MEIDKRISEIEALLRQEQESGRINNLESLTNSQGRRKSIKEIWQAIQAELAHLSQTIKDLPALPDAAVIGWAQAITAMPNLTFMEIDTTGLETEDEVIRFTLLNSSEQVVEDLYIRPASRELSADASRVNGITPEVLAEHGLDALQAWKRMQAALAGKYVISYSQEWDVKQLEAMAARHHLEPITIIGADLQRQATKYYNGEYYLTLFKLAERIGYAMPETPEQTAIHRAIAQVRVLKSLASAITDVRPPRVRKASTEVVAASSTDDDGSLGEIEDHPF